MQGPNTEKSDTSSTIIQAEENIEKIDISSNNSSNESAYQPSKSENMARIWPYIYTSHEKDFDRKIKDLKTEIDRYEEALRQLGGKTKLSSEQKEWHDKYGDVEQNLLDGNLLKIRGNREEGKEENKRLEEKLQEAQQDQSKIENLSKEIKNNIEEIKKKKIPAAQELKIMLAALTQDEARFKKALEEVKFEGAEKYYRTLYFVVRPKKAERTKIKEHLETLFPEKKLHEKEFKKIINPSTLEGLIHDVDASLLSLDTKKRSFESKDLFIKQMQQKVSDVIHVLENTIHRGTSFDEEMLRTQMQSSSQRDEIKTLSEQVQEKNSQNGVLKQELDSILREKFDLDAQLEKLRDELNIVKHVNQGLTVELSVVKHEIDEKQLKITAIETRITLLEEILTAKNAELAQSQQKLEISLEESARKAQQIKLIVDEHEIARKLLEAQLAAQINEAVSLRTQIAQALDTVVSQDQEISQNRSEIERLNSALNNANENLALPKTTALIDAVKTGDMDTIRSLLLSGAKINEKNRFGQTALMFARDQEAIEILLDNRAEINEKDHSGQTALMFATEIETVEILLRHGAKINEKDHSGQTALMIAARENYPGVVEKLLEHGANINEKDHNGLSALMLATIYDCSNIVQTLLENDANPDKKNITGQTALMLAAEKDCFDSMTKLLEKGAKINEKDYSGRTALMFASMRGNKLLVELLLKNGATINERDNTGKTALMYAEENEQKETAEVLSSALSTTLKHDKDPTGEITASESDEQSFHSRIEEPTDTTGLKQNMSQIGLFAAKPKTSAALTSTTAIASALAAAHFAVPLVIKAFALAGTAALGVTIGLPVLCGIIGAALVGLAAYGVYKFATRPKESTVFHKQSQTNEQIAVHQTNLTGSPF